ncbi:MAG: hypothetical protein AB1730_04645 [Myxococcota bacterium]|jgi:regulator of RNase E activity RraA
MTTADLSDAHGDALQVALPLFRDFGKRVAFSGPTSTMKAHEDNALVKQALSEPGAGRVPRKSSKTGAGPRDVPVRFGEVEWRPGEWLAADRDGVVAAKRPCPRGEPG